MPSFRHCEIWNYALQKLLKEVKGRKLTMSVIIMAYFFLVPSVFSSSVSSFGHCVYLYNVYFT